MDTETLAERIDATRITYPKREGGGVGVEGSPFGLEFDDPVAPESFCETVSTADDPWRAFGIKTKLADAQTDASGDVVSGEYWKLNGVLIHVEDGETTGASSVTLEVKPEWARVYVKAEASAERVAEFVRAVDEEYGVTVSFGSD